LIKHKSWPPGSPVTGGENLIRAADEQLEYRLPKIDVAIINAPYADNEGNIYFRNAATMTESCEAAHPGRGDFNVDSGLWCRSRQLCRVSDF
jgi:hypothetical protein